MTLKERQIQYKLAREKIPNLDTEIANRYKSGLSFQKIADELECGVDWVVRTLRRLNIPSRNLSDSHIKYKRDKKFFNVIDMEEKAYFLGLLYADGNVLGNTMQLCLHKKDIDILEKFQRALKTDQPIRVDRGNRRLNLRDAEIVRDLHKLGCIERKTFLITFPTNQIVPNYLLNHFIRGYFDGDGCLTSSYTKNKGIKKDRLAWKFGIDSCYAFSLGFREVIAKNCELNSKVKLQPNKRRENPTYSVTWGGTSPDKLTRIYNYLYNNATVFLDRKHNKFINLIKALQERRDWFKRTGLLGEEEKDRRVKIMIEHSDKPLRVVAEMIGITQVSLRELYNKWNIPRRNCKYGIRTL